MPNVKHCSWIWALTIYIILAKVIILICHFTCILRDWGYWPVQVQELGPWSNTAWQGVLWDCEPQSRISPRLPQHAPYALDPAVELEQSAALCGTSATATRLLLQSKGRGNICQSAKGHVDCLSGMWNTERAVVTPAAQQQLEFQAGLYRANKRLYFFANISLHVSLNMYTSPWHYLSKANTHWRWAFYLYCKHPLACMSTFNEPSENPQHVKTAFYIS